MCGINLSISKTAKLSLSRSKNVALSVTFCVMKEYRTFHINLDGQALLQCQMQLQNPEAVEAHACQFSHIRGLDI